MMHNVRVGTVVLMAFLLLTLIAPTFARQDVYIWEFPLAAVTNDGVVLHGTTDISPQEVTRQGTYENHRDLVWSPDGHTLAFRAYYLGRDDVLLITDDVGSPPFPLVTDLQDSGLPFSFTPEGKLLYAFQTQEVRQTDDGLYGPVFELNAIDPVPGAVPEVIGTFIFAPGCGGGSHLPADWRYWDETGFQGNDTTLALTPYGIVHSGDCTGRGIALADLVSGEDVMLDPSIQRTKVSPDGAQVIGIRDGELVRVDLATGAVDVLPHDPAAIPDQVAWGAPDTDTIFYSVREPGPEKLVWDEADAQALGEAAGIDAEWMYLDFWMSEIHRVDLATQTDTLLHRMAGYAVGRIIATPDGAGLLFSVVPNMAEWVMAVLDGSLEAGTRANEPEALAYVWTQLYYLDLATGALSWLGEDVNMTALNTAVYVAQRE